MNKLMVGDQVIVRKGKAANKIGVIQEINWKNDTVIVKDVNLMTKHKRPSGQQDPGGIHKVEAPIRICNVGILSPKTNKAARVGIKVMEDGRKVRFLKQCGTILETKKSSKKQA